MLQSVAPRFGAVDGQFVVEQSTGSFSSVASSAAVGALLSAAPAASSFFVEQSVGGYSTAAGTYSPACSVLPYADGFGGMSGGLVSLTGQTQPLTSQTLPWTVQSVSLTGQSMPLTGQTLPLTGQSMPFEPGPWVAIDCSVTVPASMFKLGA